MRDGGLVARPKKRFKKTTRRGENPPAPNLLQQDFEAKAPNEKWVADITYIRTWEGWVYLAVIIDLFSRRVVGFALDDHMRIDLPLQALMMAIQRRRPAPGLVHHSDRGSQYTSAAYRAALDNVGAALSMSGTGNCYDNAVAESFFSTLKQELVFRHAWPTKRVAINAVTRYITQFYNPSRIHSANQYLSPVEKELAFVTAALAA